MERDKKRTALIELESNRNSTRHLIARGMPNYILRIPPFDIDTHLTSISSELPGMRVKRIPKKRQQAYLNDVLRNPFRSPYLMVVCSMPNDQKAKLVAAVIMEKALSLHMKGKTFSKNPPVWHTIASGFDNKILDEKPSMLVVSNVTADSTPFKIEKLRDLLETHHDIPRIVVCTGTDPVSFMNGRAYLAMNYSLFIRSNFIIGI